MAGQRVSKETPLRREKKSGNGEIPSANLGGGKLIFFVLNQKGQISGKRIL